MNLVDVPDKIPQPWAAGAGAGYIRPIPNASQIGVNAGYASWHDGFVPLNATPTGAGGIPPFIQDFNGVLNSVSAWSQWFQAGGAIFWDLTFATEIGGYPRGAVVRSNADANKFWINQVDNNATNPDGGGANWRNLFAPIFINAEFTGAAFQVDAPAVFTNTLNVGANAQAVTQAPGDNTTLIATDAFVQTAVANGVSAARKGRADSAYNVFIPGSGSTNSVTTAAFVAPCTGVLLVVGACNPSGVMSGTGTLNMGLHVNAVDVPLTSEATTLSMTLMAAYQLAAGDAVDAYSSLTMAAFGGVAISTGLRVAYVFVPN